MNNKVCSVCGEVVVHAKGMCRRCYNKQYRENLSHEDIEKRNAYQRKYREKPEHRDKHNASQRKENRTPEQIEKKNASQRNENRTPEQIEKRNARQRKENRTPEQIDNHNTSQRKYREKPEHRDNNKAYQRKYRDNLSPEQIEARNVYEKQRRHDNNPNTAAQGTEEHRIKISCAQQGISIDEWDGFAVESKYCPKFNNACRERNREKYGRRCFLCNKTESANGRKLSVHHVDMNKNQGCDSVWQLVPLCSKHHGGSHNDTWHARIEYLLNNVW